jgi:hypothetical protein
VSLQLEQVLSQARQLSPQEQLQLASQLFGEVNRTNGINEAPDNQPEAELEYVDGILVVKSQGKKLSGDLVAAMHEERIQD